MKDFCLSKEKTKDRLHYCQNSKKVPADAMSPKTAETKSIVKHKDLRRNVPCVSA